MDYKIILTTIIFEAGNRFPINEIATTTFVTILFLGVSISYWGHFKSQIEQH
jgi:hypothetical protein